MREDSRRILLRTSQQQGVSARNQWKLGDRGEEECFVQGADSRSALATMASLLSGGERERVNIRRGLGAGGDTTGPPAEGNGYGWGLEAPASSAPAAKTSTASRQRSTAAATGSGSRSAGSGGGGGGGRGARSSAIVGGGALVEPADDPLVVKRLTSQVRVCFSFFCPSFFLPSP